MTPTNKSSFSPNQVKGQLIQQPRLTKQGSSWYPNDQDQTISPQPASPLRASSGHWSHDVSPQPPQHPESQLYQRHNHHAALLFSGKTVDHDAVKSLRSSGSLRRPSHDNDCESITNTKWQFATKSAPTSIFSSPVTSPHKLSSVDLFDPSNNFSQDFNDILRMPAKTTRSLDLSPRHSLGNHTIQGGSHSHQSKYGTRVGLENNHVDAYPLPLPPGASLQPQQSPAQHQTNITLHHSTENFHSIKGQWQKVRLIGRGSLGSVYQATNLETGASCAMKEVDLFPDDPKSADNIKQLDQEIRIHGQLHHPNIVQYYDSEIVGDQLCIYMEYVQPGSLAKFMHEYCGALTESVVRNFTRHILSGLAYLHNTKTIHGDIKCANMLVDVSGILKIADFKMSKNLTEKSYELSLKGSPHWMAPELMIPSIMKELNPDVAMAVDIWSLGCTIIEMLTGKPPWSEFLGHQAMFMVLHRSPDIPKTLSPEGQDFLEQCFRRNPAERPSAAMLLTHAFVQNLHDRDVTVHSQGCHKEDTGTKDEPRKQSAGDSSKHSCGVVPTSFRARIFCKIKNLIG